MTFWDKVKDFLTDEPIYANRPSSDSLVEGWRFAYDQQEARADLAERKLKMLRDMSDDMIKFGWGSQYGHDIRTVLNMTQEEMDEDYGD